MAVAAETRERPKVSFWNDPKVRSIFAQFVFLLLLAWASYEIVLNTAANLARLNKNINLSFLGTTAGFDIIQSLIAYTRADTYGRAIAVGFLNTLLVAALGIVFATTLGFVAGVMRLSSNWVMRAIATGYVEVVRNIPLLLQLFFWYATVLKPLPGPRQSISFLDSVFISNRGLVGPRPIWGEGAEWVAIALVTAIALAIAVHSWARRRQQRTGEQFPRGWASLALILGLPILVFILLGSPVTFDYPELKGFNFVGGMTVIPEFVALLLALSIYTATFIAEIVRGGILAVSHGQTEASLALGLTSGQTLRLVIIPQAMRVIIPPLTNQYLNLTKNSSLAIAIGYPDLVAMGGVVLNQSGHAIEVFVIWMIVYLSLSLITAAAMNWYNARVRLVER